jgi:undecaprenyl pyrophosphate phosphatase UppP
LWTADFHDGQGLGATDKAYVAQVVAARTGMSQADAEKRVNDVIVEAKTAADAARKGAAKLSFWLTVAMLFGAFAASLAAVEGGSLRDGTWNDRVLIPRPI